MLQQLYYSKPSILYRDDSVSQFDKALPKKVQKPSIHLLLWERASKCGQKMDVSLKSGIYFTASAQMSASFLSSNSFNCPCLLESAC